MKDWEEGEKGEMCGGGREGREEERRGDGGKGPCTTRDTRMSSSPVRGSARCYHGCETHEAWPTHMSAIALHVLTAPVHVMLGNVWLGNSNSRARPSTASRQTPMGA